MSNYAEVKADFLRECCQAGWVAASEVGARWVEAIPPHILRRWLGQLNQTIAVDPSRPRRLVNHYKVGADPELWMQRSNGDIKAANDLSFKAGLAWGADNNGRLCEIRPHPSRHALEVLASTWSTLWWMHVLAPYTLTYLWKAGAWNGRDGVGGHIHFGRKRPSVERETLALDTLVFWMFQAHIFSVEEGRLRIRHSRGHGDYGAMSDRRPQLYGWEYRTPPSWLDTPWLAYFTLTLAKLAVFDPDMLPRIEVGMETWSASTLRGRMRGLLAYYKGRDDDAALAFEILSRTGYPRFTQLDFKAAWGIFPNPTLLAAKPPDFTLPTQITPTRENLAELAKSMLENRHPEWIDSAPTWKPARLPKSYYQIITDTATYHHPGIGEMVRDLIGHSNHPLRFTTNGGSAEHGISFPHAYMPAFQPNWLRDMRKRFPQLSLSTYRQDEEGSSRILIAGEYGTSAEYRKPAIDFLTSGWLPLWRAEDVREDSFKIWEDTKNSEMLARMSPKPPVVKKPASLAIWPQMITAPKPKLRSAAEISAELEAIQASAAQRTSYEPLNIDDILLTARRR